MQWTSEAYPCAPTSPAAGRAFCTLRLRELLGRHPRSESLIADAEVIVSELITNAVNADCDHAELMLRVSGDCVRIEVRDDAGGTPVVLNPGIGEGHGRGLMIVSALAGDWGVERLPSGKSVWAELPLPHRRAAGKN